MANGRTVTKYDPYMEKLRAELAKLPPHNYLVENGDEVMLDVDAIMKHDSWEKRSSEYQHFVLWSRGHIFHAVYSGNNNFRFEEEPKWDFHSGYLIIVKKKEYGEDEWTF